MSPASVSEIQTILLTGFEPFGEDQINPSWEVAKALDGERIADACIVAARLPCVFGTALRTLDQLLERHRPSLVLALGLASGSSALAVERVAINVDDARIPDNAGAQPVDQPVVAGAPAAYFSRLPIKAMVAAMRDAGYPAEVSQSAGTFVCNHLFFGLQHGLRNSTVRSGFMHLPYLPVQAARLRDQPSMALESMVEATRIALMTAWRTGVDIRREGGALD
jgi:pyroglutamyl-peptidase